MQQLFRFHTGSIKSENALLELRKLVNSFDSILVRLKGEIIMQQSDFLEYVSIPYWFD